MQVLANVVAVLLLAAPLASLAAQSSSATNGSAGARDSAAPPITPGARIRITRPERPPRTGRLHSLGRDSLAVEWRQGENESIALSEVKKVELYLGHSGRSKHLALGVLGGLAVGGAAGKVMMDRDQRAADARKEAAYAQLASECKDIEVPALCLIGGIGIELGSIQTPEKLLYGLGVGALLGAGIGMIGTDRWHPIIVNEPARVGLGVPAPARIGLGLAAAY